MKRAVLCAVSAAVFSLALASAAPLAAWAEEPKEKVLPSDRTIRVLENFTWVFVLEHYRAKPETKDKVKDLDPEKFMIPKEDARRIIRRGDLSAQAQLCGLLDHQAANKVKMMKVERESGKWSQEQLLFIHFLHFTAFAARMDYIKAFFQDSDKDKRTVEEKLRDLAKEKREYNCPEEMRQRVMHNIEEYVRSAEKS